LKDNAPSLRVRFKVQEVSFIKVADQRWLRETKAAAS
jgi:hypothetical protein